MHLNVIEIKNIIPNDVIHYASFLVETNENPTSSAVNGAEVTAGPNGFFITEV